MGAGQFDFAEGQGGGGHNGVDARLGEDSAADWVRVRGMGRSRSQMRNKRCYTQSIQPGGHVIEDDAPAFGEAFQAGGRERAW